MLPKKRTLGYIKYLLKIVMLDCEENHTYKRIGGEEIQEAIDHRQIGT